MDMSDTKNPDHEAENPAPIPGRQSEKPAKMIPRSDAPPGMEQDGQGNVIPFAQRTKEDQKKTMTSRKDA
jgi:hypothetical protein